MYMYTVWLYTCIHVACIALRAYMYMYVLLNSIIRVLMPTPSRSSRYGAEKVDYFRDTMVPCRFSWCEQIHDYAGLSSTCTCMSMVKAGRLIDQTCSGFLERARTRTTVHVRGMQMYDMYLYFSGYSTRHIQ